MKDTNNTLNSGDYALATKWSDADPKDHWCVGFFDSMLLKGVGALY